MRNSVIAHFPPSKLSIPRAQSIMMGCGSVPVRGRGIPNRTESRALDTTPGPESVNAWPVTGRQSVFLGAGSPRRQLASEVHLIYLALDSLQHPARVSA